MAAGLAVTTTDCAAAEMPRARLTSALLTVSSTAFDCAATFRVRLTLALAAVVTAADWQSTLRLRLMLAADAETVTGRVTPSAALVRLTSEAPAAISIDLVLAATIRERLTAPLALTVTALVAQVTLRSALTAERYNFRLPHKTG
jgi:hypothetical protein